MGFEINWPLKDLFFGHCQYQNKKALFADSIFTKVLCITTVYTTILYDTDVTYIFVAKLLQTWMEWQKKHPSTYFEKWSIANDKARFSNKNAL